MTFWFTAKKSFTPSNDIESWSKYIDWSKLAHLKELVSLDAMLCELAFKVDYGNEEMYNHIILEESYTTELFNSYEYVLKNVENKIDFNFLAVVKEPQQECNSVQLSHFEFVGYDLVDYDYSTSALTNCGGFSETFSNDQINEVGLINSYAIATDIRKRLFENNPNEWHADCFIFALWRHKTIGRAL